MDLLDIAGVSTQFPTRSGVVRAVDDLSLTLGTGRVLGLVGESGCGKTITALSILDLVPPPGRITAGTILFEGRDLRSLPESEMRSLGAIKKVGSLESATTRTCSPKESISPAMTSTGSLGGDRLPCAIPAATAQW